MYLSQAYVTVRAVTDPIIEGGRQQRLNKDGRPRRTFTHQEKWLDFAHKLEDQVFRAEDLMEWWPIDDFTDAERFQLYAALKPGVEQTVAELRKMLALFRGDGSTCDVCGGPVLATRSDARYCSQSCRQTAYRERRS